MSRRNIAQNEYGGNSIVVSNRVDKKNISPRPKPRYMKNSSSERVALSGAEPIKS